MMTTGWPPGGVGMNILSTRKISTFYRKMGRYFGEVNFALLTAAFIYFSDWLLGRDHRDTYNCLKQV
jgi:hypothetical protein